MQKLILKCDIEDQSTKEVDVALRRFLRKCTVFIKDVFDLHEFIIHCDDMDEVNVRVRKESIFSMKS